MTGSARASPLRGRYACIDIGSNTTRLLVAEPVDAGVREVLQRRDFTHLGRALVPGGGIPAPKLREIAGLAGAHARAARDMGAGLVRAVGTAAIRQAENRDALADAVRQAGGVDLCVLSPDEEARLAFRGATCGLARETGGDVAVVDVGGGSSELAVGTVREGVRWSASFRVGSGALTARYGGEDPPSTGQLAAMREHVERALEGLRVDRPRLALAVGGSATSLRRLVGPVIDARTLDRALTVVCAEPAAQVADRFGLALARVHLLPAGMVVLAGLAVRLDSSLRVAGGGLREGVILDLAAQDADARAAP